MKYDDSYYMYLAEIIARKEQQWDIVAFYQRIRHMKMDYKNPEWWN